MFSLWNFSFERIARICIKQKMVMGGLNNLPNPSSLDFCRRYVYLYMLEKACYICAFGLSALTKLSSSSCAIMIHCLLVEKKKTLEENDKELLSISI